MTGINVPVIRIQIYNNSANQVISGLEALLDYLVMLG